MTDINCTVSPSAVPAIVRHVVRLIAPHTFPEINDDHQLLGDLGFHSLALAELGFALEDLFELDPITPERAMSLCHVGDVASLIGQAIECGDARVPSVADMQALCAQYGQDWSPRD